MTPPQHTHASATADIRQILVGERLRSDTPDIRLRIEEFLVPSIAELGLIQPIVLERLDAPMSGVNVLGEPITSDLNLVAGWSRLVSFGLLKYTHIPYNFRSAIPDYTRLELELEENIRRNEMTWQDIALSIRRIHFARVHLVALENKGKAKADQVKPWGQRATGALLGVALGEVSNSILLADHIIRGDIEISTAASPHAANNILLQRREDEIAKHRAEKQRGQVASLQKSIKPEHRRVKTPSDEAPASRPVQVLNPTAEPVIRPVVDLSHMLFNLDSMYPQEDGTPAGLDRLEPASVDLIYTDPPFGIDMKDLEGRKDIGRVADAHDVGENLDQMRVFFKHAFRVLKDKSYLLQWCDMKNWDKFVGRMVEKKDKESGERLWVHEPGWLEKAGFTVCPYPIVWHKTHPCKNQAAGIWPTKSFEYLCVARKGKASLLKPISDSVFSCSGTSERKLQSNPFAKPFEFSKWLLEYFARPGDVVVDCYAGEGSLVRALLNLGMSVIAIEKDPLHFNRLVEHVKKHYRGVHGEEVEFV